MIRCCIRKDFDRFSKTCQRFFYETFLTKESELNCNINTFWEFWNGRKFIGAFYGEDFHDGEIYIDEIFVNPKYRNQGYGRYILEFVKERFYYIMVESIPNVVNFYRKCGFHKWKNQSDRIYIDTVDMYYKGKKNK